jgi:hypothetical protein
MMETVAHMGEVRNEYNILVLKGRCHLGDDRIKVDLRGTGCDNVDHTHLAQDTDQ